MPPPPQQSSPLHFTRVLIATPAILLIMATCAALLVATMQGNNDNVIDISMIRGAVVAHNIAVVMGDTSRVTTTKNIDNYDDGVQLESHKRHHFPFPDRKKSSHHEENKNGFDFYVFSSEL